ncbi:hypothetical protein PENTCL1PPCAC_18857, partial [Pristionchus entomophagus]
TRGLYAAFYLITPVFLFAYSLGLLGCAAFRKVMISQGFLRNKREMISMQYLYEKTRSRQDQLWKVTKQ